MTIVEGAKVTLTKGQGQVTARIEAGGKAEDKVFDTVISAVGIVGNVEDLGLEETA
jgi:dihydrolipoamide dehydrogenase